MLQMPVVDLLFLGMLAASVTVGLSLLARLGFARARCRLAYLAYFDCVLAVGWFDWLLVVNGPDVFMAFGLFMFIVLVAGGIALMLSFYGRPSRRLRVLALLLLGSTLSLILSAMVLPTVMFSLAQVCTALMMGVIASGWREWWQGEFSPGYDSAEALLADIRVLTTALDQAGEHDAAACLREGLAACNGLTDGWAALLDKVDQAARALSSSRVFQPQLKRVAHAVEKAVYRS